MDVTIESTPQYWLGVFLAALSGGFSSLGQVLQKYEVARATERKRLFDEEEFFVKQGTSSKEDVAKHPSVDMRILVKRPLWLLGLAMQIVFSGALFLGAQVYVGPALSPGLQNGFGLLVLVIASIKIVKERIHFHEAVGIILMIASQFMLGISGLSVDIRDFDIFDYGFIVRTTTFSVVWFGACALFEVLQRVDRNNKHRGIYLSLLAGFMLSISNFWVALFMEPIVQLAELESFCWPIDVPCILRVLVQTFTCQIISIAILIYVNWMAIVKTQQSFCVGQASVLIPIQLAPQQFSPAAVYFWVYALTPPSATSTVLMTFAIVSYT